MEIEKIIATLHSYERKVLPVLKETNSFEKIAEKTKLQKVEVMRALQWLQNKKLIITNKKLQEQVSLDENGLKYRSNGLPERNFLGQIKHPTPLDIIAKRTNNKQEVSISLGILRTKGAIEIKKDSGKTIISITDIGIKIHDRPYPEQEFLKKNFPINTSELKDLDKLSFESFKKRNKIVKINIVKIITAENGIMKIMIVH